jgi:hypothetical protein
MMGIYRKLGAIPGISGKFSCYLPYPPLRNLLEDLPSLRVKCLSSFLCAWVKNNLIPKKVSGGLLCTKGGPL